MERGHGPAGKDEQEDAPCGMAVMKAAHQRGAEICSYGHGISRICVMIPGQREGFRGTSVCRGAAGYPQRRMCVLPLPGIFLEVVAGLLARLGDHAVATAYLVVSGEVFGAAAIEAPMQAAGFGLRGIRRKDDAQPPLAGFMAFSNGRHIQDTLAGYSGLFPILAGGFRIVGKKASRPRAGRLTREGVSGMLAVA